MKGRVGKSDMNMLMHPSVRFEYAGLFQTTREWIHPKRIGTNYEIICVTQGAVDLAEEERDYHLERGQILILSPGKCHFGTQTSERVSFYWVHFSLLEGELPFTRRCFSGFENMSLFKELLHVNNLPDAPVYLVNSILLHILSELCHLSGEHAVHYDSRAEKIYEWIRINISAKLTVERIANEFRYSSDHLSRICKKNFGMGAGELIDRFLVSRIKELLSNTDLYIKEIARELEFSDDKALIGYFKYHEGCSPTEFRNRFSRLHMNLK